MTLAGKKLLIAEDHPNFRKIMKMYLHALGPAEIHEAQSGSQAWQIIGMALNDRKPFDLILADVNMPDGTGIDLLRAIRESASTAQLPVILVTAEAESDMVAQALALKVNDYVVKPFTIDTLQEKIFSVLNIKKSPETSSY